MAPSSPQPPASPRRTRLRVIIGLLILGVGVWLLLERYLGNMAYFVITSESMEPALNIGDRVLMEKRATYGVGDIVVVSEPGKPDQRLVKRIIAVAGDRVSAWRDDLTVTRPPQIPPARARRRWEIRPGEVFVAGDNRAVSHDSRDFGPVPLENIHGKVIRRKDSLLRWSEVK